MAPCFECKKVRDIHLRSVDVSDMSRFSKCRKHLSVAIDTDYLLESLCSLWLTVFWLWTWIWQVRISVLSLSSEFPGGIFWWACSSRGSTGVETSKFLLFSTALWISRLFNFIFSAIPKTMPMQMWAHANFHGLFQFIRM